MHRDSEHDNANDTDDADDANDGRLDTAEEGRHDGWQAKKQKIGRPNYQTVSIQVLDKGPKKCFHKQPVAHSRQGVVDVAFGSDEMAETAGSRTAQPVEAAPPRAASPPIRDPPPIEEPQTKSTGRRKVELDVPAPGRYNQLRVIVKPYLDNRDVSAEEKLKEELFQNLSKQVLRWHDMIEDTPHGGIEEIFDLPCVADAMRERLGEVRDHMEDMGKRAMTQTYDYQMMLKIRQTFEETSEQYAYLTSELSTKRHAGKARLDGDLEKLTLIQTTLPKKGDPKKVVSEDSRAAARKVREAMPSSASDEFDLW